MNWLTCEVTVLREQVEAMTTELANGKHEAAEATTRAQDYIRHLEAT